jgi:hypothetical protein
MLHDPARIHMRRSWTPIQVGGRDPGHPLQCISRPRREKVAGGLIAAPKLTDGKANRLYG